MMDREWISAGICIAFSIGLIVGFLICLTLIRLLFCHAKEMVEQANEPSEIQYTHQDQKTDDDEEDDKPLPLFSDHDIPNRDMIPRTMWD